MWVGTIESGRPRFRALRSRAIGGRTVVGRDHRESNCHESSYRGSNNCWLSHWKCDVNKRQGRFGGWKNNRLIGKKPLNPAGIEEENQGRKDLVVIQSSRINLCGQWCVELLHSQSTIAKSRLHLEDLTRLHSVKPSLPATTFLPYGEFS